MSIYSPDPADEEATGLAALTSFRATFRLHFSHTVADIYTTDGKQAVARMTKVGSLRKRSSYELFTGTALKTRDGTLTETGAVDADDVPIGVVNVTGGAKDDAEIHPLTGGMRAGVSDDITAWRVVQPGLPPLVPHPANSHTARVYRPNKVADILAKFVGTPLWLPIRHPDLRFQYKSPECDGFTVSMKGEHMTVTVHDPRVDRRLILACLAALALKLLWTWKGEAIDAAYTLGVRTRRKP